MARSVVNMASLLTRSYAAAASTGNSIKLGSAIYICTSASAPARVERTYGSE